MSVQNHWMIINNQHTCQRLALLTAFRACFVLGGFVNENTVGI